MSMVRHMLAAALGIASPALPASPTIARARSADGCTVFAREAATRAGLPIAMVARVMLAESGGDPRAISPKGAIGCMQIMPATWAALTRRHDLGSDPFDARMNMIGGALYLAELRARFGIPGAYAAYNAGPNRYMRFAAKGMPLPAETVAYAARLGGAGTTIIRANAQARWQEAALFVGRFGSGAKPAPVPRLTAIVADNAGNGGDTSTGNAVPAMRVDPMFPLPTRDVALRR